MAAKYKTKAVMTKRGWEGKAWRDGRLIGSCGHGHMSKPRALDCARRIRDEDKAKR